MGTCIHIGLFTPTLFNLPNVVVPLLSQKGLLGPSITRKLELKAQFHKWYNYLVHKTLLQIYYNQYSPMALLIVVPVVVVLDV